MADFFSKSVREITLAEVESLYSERVPENIRLEYKEKLPDDTANFKETVAKALSAFANTYGGYLIYGISTDAKGNPTAMNGVPESNNLAQRIISVGYEQVFPPVIAVVSNPIVLPNGKFVYVIYQDLSLEAPHFLTHRRGAYIRTSEFSQTFQAALANWEELRLLHDRRKVATEQREKIQQRAKQRSALFLPLSEGDHKPLVLHVAIAPAFPFRRLIELNKIESAIQGASFTISSGSIRRTYPFSGEATAVQDSRVLITPDSYLEGTAWGTSYYAHIVDANSTSSAIYFEHILSDLSRQIKFGSRLLKSCGFDGLVNIKASLLNSQWKNFQWGQYGEVEARCIEPGEIEYELNRPLHILMQDYRSAWLEIFRVFAFAANWQGVFAKKDDNLIGHLQQAEDFYKE
jgi:hypothetical protein